MSKSRHPNVVEFLGHRHDPTTGELHIFMEYLAGGSVSSLLSHFGALPEKLVRILARHILTGIAHLHSSRIVHRDIKGANVLLGLDADCKFPVVAKLADFGCSRIINGMTQHSQFDSLQGTPHWMAPEVIKQTGHSRPADIWSAACTMVEMLTGGRPPFSEFRIPHSAMLAIANFTDPNALVLPCNLTPECDAMLRLCLAPDPTMRPSAAALLAGEHGFLLSDPAEELRQLLEDPNCLRLSELIADYVRDRTTMGASASDGTPGGVLKNVVLEQHKVAAPPQPQPQTVSKLKSRLPPPGASRTPVKGSNGGRSPSNPMHSHVSAPNLRPLVRSGSSNGSGNAITPSKNTALLRRSTQQA
jgi:serine/threonine protein kinase